MAIGIKVSKEKHDVKTSTIENTLLDTRYPLQKVFKKDDGYFDIPDGGTDQVTISHKLGYKPQVLAYVERSPVNRMRYIANTRTIGINEKVYGLLNLTDNSIVISITDISDPASGQGVYRYVYYIFYDQG